MQAHTFRYLRVDNKPIPTEKNKKVIGIDLSEKIMTEFVALRAEMHSYKKMFGR